MQSGRISAGVVCDKVIAARATRACMSTRQASCSVLKSLTRRQTLRCAMLDIAFVETAIRWHMCCLRW